jgi:hypothetical protein
VRTYGGVKAQFHALLIPVSLIYRTALHLGSTRSWLRHSPTSWKIAGSIPDGFIGIFHLPIPSGPGVDSASNRNEYQGYLLGGVKVAGATFMCWLSGNWKPTPSGALRAFQARMRIALPCFTSAKWLSVSQWTGGWTGQSRNAAEKKGRKSSEIWGFHSSDY